MTFKKSNVLFPLSPSHYSLFPLTALVSTFLPFLFIKKIFKQKISMWLLLIVYKGNNTDEIQAPFKYFS